MLEKPQGVPSSYRADPAITSICICIVDWVVSRSGSRKTLPKHESSWFLVRHGVVRAAAEPRRHVREAAVAIARSLHVDRVESFPTIVFGSI